MTALSTLDRPSHPEADDRTNKAMEKWRADGGIGRVEDNISNFNEWNHRDHPNKGEKVDLGKGVIGSVENHEQERR